MKNDLLPHFFDKPIAFHRILAEVAGSVNGGLFLSQALYWTGRTSLEDGWFYKTAEEWQEETFLSRREQETVRRALTAMGVLEEKRRGIPATMHFRINRDVLMKKLEEIAENKRGASMNTRLAESAKLDATKPPNCVGGKRQSNTENTTETTSEITSERYISAQAEFDEFWAAYPKRPNNPKAPAVKKYVNARQRLKVSHETLVNAAKAYAASVAGTDPKFIAQAVNWLNQRRWECDFAPAEEERLPEGINLSELVLAYGGKAGHYADVEEAVIRELKRGATFGQLVEAAKMHKLWLKEQKYQGREIDAPILETWLRFKWREFADYEVVRVGPDRRLTVRQKKVKA